jgi:hypothetical protein
VSANAGEANRPGVGSSYRGVEGVAAQEIAVRVVLRVGSGHAFAGRLGDLHVAKRGGQLSQQVVQGAAAGVVGDGRAVAVESGVAQPRDAGACDEIAGAEAEDEGWCTAGVVGSGPPDGVDPRVVRSLVGREASVAVDPEQ